ncbi:ankyrin repeat domain-containing protein [Cardinium endosymbiont of Nabis limbatus]|uniref:ankyrin repeat domain-containing protein n=1 Tax=Cardinium endosymbiont of Nabis limbatus TaxID=3066217 RepID=UPI003AF3DD37
MKKYTHYRVALFIGLLSLQTLSACVHTRQVLGGDLCNQPSKEGWLPDVLKKWPNWSPIKIVFGGVVTGFSFIVLCYGMKRWIPASYFENPSNATHPRINNDPGLTTGLPFIPTEKPIGIVPYINLTEEQAIIDAINRDPADFVPDGKSSDWATDAELDDRVTLQHAMVLDDRILRDLKANDFSTKRVEYWLAKGLNINAKDRQNRTLLMHAVSYSNKVVVQFIIDKGADVNARAMHGDTALHLAIGRDHLDIVDYLVQVPNIDLNAKDDYDTRPVHLAVDRGLDFLKALLRYKKQIDINAKDGAGNTPLYRSIHRGYVSGAEFLVHCGTIDLNVKDRYDRVALHLVARKGYANLLEEILKKTSDVNAKDKYGYTPLHLAAYYGRPSVVKRLVRCATIDLNAQNNKGKTPLHLATYRGHEAVVKILVTQPNIAINAQDENKDTPLHLAVKGNHIAVVNILMHSPFYTCEK